MATAVALSAASLAAFDHVVERCEQPRLAAEEVLAAEVDGGGVVRDEGAVRFQTLQKRPQLHEQLPLGQGLELAPLRILQKRSTGDSTRLVT